MAKGIHSSSWAHSKNILPLLVIALVGIPAAIYGASNATRIFGKAYLPTVPPPPVQSITLNNSFETRTNKKNPIPDSWSWYSTKKLTSTVGYNCKVAHYGGCSFLFLGNYGLKGIGILSQDLTTKVKAGHKYRVSFWTRADKAKKVLNFNFKLDVTKDNNVSVFIHPQVQNMLVTGDKFTNFTFDFAPIPEGATFTKAQLLFNYGGNQGKLYLDDVVLTDITEAPVPTPTATAMCTSTLENIVYTTPINFCPSYAAQTAQFSCADGLTGNTGDESACTNPDELKSQAETICATAHICPVSSAPTPTPTPSYVEIPS